ncbi:MAG TPA: hypothetical protein VNW99_01630 [Cytophagaceae bacterium]|jgi:hypothetical protein|nr:hypothetical protein [Cytophagaceae bacterium]
MKNFTPFIFLLMCMIPFQGNSQNNISQKSSKENELLASVETKDASDGNNDAYIKLKVSGGIAPYTIHCFSPYSLPTHTTGNELILEKIKSGDYLFVIQDKSGKSTAKEVKISDLK